MTQHTFSITSLVFLLVLDFALIIIVCVFGPTITTFPSLGLVLLESQRLFLRLVVFVTSHLTVILLLMLLNYGMFYTFSKGTKLLHSWITGMTLLLGNLLLLIMLWGLVFMAFRLLLMLVLRILTIWSLPVTKVLCNSTVGISYLN